MNLKHKSLIGVALLVLILGSYACSSDASQTTPVALRPAPSRTAGLSPTVTPELTPTIYPTPQFAFPTLEVTAIDVAPPLWDGFPGPAGTPVRPIPPPHEQVALHPDSQVVLLLGVDRESSAVGPSDTIILLFYNKNFSRASLVSLPRDLLVYVPGYDMQRINTAYELGGIDLLNLTLRYNFGLQATKWAVVHLDDFQKFVDDLGGVKIQDTYPVSDPWCQVAAGKTIQMSGYLTLCYVRSRMGNSDLDRNQRQQQVFGAILREVGRSTNLSRFPEFYERYAGSVKTNLTLDDMLVNTPLLLRLREDERVAYYHLSWDDVTPWQVPTTLASVLLVEPDRLDAILNKAQRFILSP